MKNVPKKNKKAAAKKGASKSKMGKKPMMGKEEMPMMKYGGKAKKKY
jgi:hypothetical protein